MSESKTEKALKANRNFANALAYPKSYPKSSPRLSTTSKVRVNPEVKTRLNFGKRVPGFFTTPNQGFFNYSTYNLENNVERPETRGNPPELPPGSQLRWKSFEKISSVNQDPPEYYATPNNAKKAANNLHFELLKNDPPPGKKPFHLWKLLQAPDMSIANLDDGYKKYLKGNRSAVSNVLPRVLNGSALKGGRRRKTRKQTYKQSCKQSRKHR